MQQCGYEIWNFKTFNFQEESLSEKCLNYLLDLRNFVAEELHVGAETCRIWHLI